MNLFQATRRVRPAKPLIFSLLFAGALMTTSCTLIIEDEMRAWEATRAAALARDPAPATPEPAMLALEEMAATATIGVGQLRVRQAPSTNAEVVGFVYNNQTYPVIGRSSDGLWMKLGGIPGLPDESGWVISELALVIGDFSMIPVEQVPDPQAAPPTRRTEVVTVATPEPVTPAPQPETTPVTGTTSLTGTLLISVTAAEAVSVVESSVVESIETVAEAAGLVATVVTDGTRLRVRSLPSTDAEIVGYAYPGEVFRVLQQSADGLWTELEGSSESQANATGGWVASEYLAMGE